MKPDYLVPCLNVPTRARRSLRWSPARLWSIQRDTLKRIFTSMDVFMFRSHKTGRDRIPSLVLFRRVRSNPSS